MTTAPTTGQQAIHAAKVVALSAIAAFLGLMVFIGILFAINPALDHQATPAPASAPAPTVAAPIAATQSAPQPTPAPAVPSTTVDAPAGDGPIGCWNEPNKEMPTGYEMIQGPLSAAPVGSILVDCPR